MALHVSSGNRLQGLDFHYGEDLMPGSGVAVHIDPEAIRPLIEQAVEAAVARVEAARPTVGDRIAYSEAEAARLIGLAPHQLRDERLRERIKASAIVGRRIRYTRGDLMEYLLSRRWSKNDSSNDRS